jgi:5'-deoxynucleotidase YfbR-like HD superfamily hydrolase
LSWIQTYTGKKFYPLEPNRADIDILDIAHALSMQCRFAGHCTKFYSTAEHSVHLSRQFEDRNIARWALLHDAPEAYLVDVPRPIKPLLTNYSEIEDRLMDVIADRFGLPFMMPQCVKDADASIIHDERMFVMKMTDEEWESVDQFEPLGVFIECWSPVQAKAEFLQRYIELL